MESLIFILYILLAITLVRTLLSILRSSKPSPRLPPGPVPLPVIGSLLKLGDKPHKSLAELAKLFGPIMSLKLGRKTVVVISSPALAREVLQKQDLAFSTRSVPNAVHAHGHNKYSVVWLPVSDQWRSLRKALNSNIFSEEEGDSKEMAPKMDKALLAQLKVERAKQSSGAVAPKRKSSRLQKELNVDSFLDADLSGDLGLDLVVEQVVEGGTEKPKRKTKVAAVEGTPAAKKLKTSVGPSVLSNYQDALEHASGLLCEADEVSLAEMPLQTVGEQMLVELGMATARGRYLASRSHSLGRQVVTLTEANIKLNRQSATMAADLQKVTKEKDAALKSKRDLEEERDTAVTAARNLELKISKWDVEMERYRNMSMGMLEKVKHARREAIDLYLQSPAYRQEVT